MTDVSKEIRDDETPQEPNDQKDYWIITNQLGELRGAMSLKKGEMSSEDVLLQYYEDGREVGEEMYCFCVDSLEEYENSIYKMRDAVINSRPRLETDSDEMLKPITRPRDDKFVSDARKVMAKTSGQKIFRRDNSQAQIGNEENQFIEVDLEAKAKTDGDVLKVIRDTKNG